MLDKTNEGWTDDRIELLKAIYETGSDGWLAEEINKRTGSDFTRNSIIGKRERLKLFRSKDYDGIYHRIDSKPGRQKNTGESRRGKHSKRVFRSDFRSGPKMPADLKGLENIEKALPPPQFLGLTLFYLKDDQCRYPRGAQAPFLYCGQPTKEDSSYCAYCHSLCYERETPYERRRREKGGEYLIRKVA